MTQLLVVFALGFPIPANMKAPENGLEVVHVGRIFEKADGSFWVVTRILRTRDYVYWSIRWQAGGGWHDDDRLVEQMLDDGDMTDLLSRQIRIPQ